MEHDQVETSNSTAMNNICNMNVKCFEFTDHKNYDMENEIDPENHFYTNNCHCEYYTNDQFKSSVRMNNALTILHFNSRSLYTNFEEIKDYLRQFQNFHIIALSETWLNVNRECDTKLDGYDLFNVN